MIERLISSMIQAIIRTPNSMHRNQIPILNHSIIPPQKHLPRKLLFPSPYQVDPFRQHPHYLKCHPLYHVSTDCPVVINFDWGFARGIEHEVESPVLGLHVKGGRLQLCFPPKVRGCLLILPVTIRLQRKTGGGREMRGDVRSHRFVQAEKMIDVS